MGFTMEFGVSSLVAHFFPIDFKVSRHSQEVGIEAAAAGAMTIGETLKEVWNGLFDVIFPSSKKIPKRSGPRCA